MTGPFLFHAFWIEAGMQSKYETFPNEETLLAFVKKAKDEDGSIRNLRVIAGCLLDFEPKEVVASWKIVGNY